MNMHWRRQGPLLVARCKELSIISYSYVYPPLAWRLVTTTYSSLYPPFGMGIGNYFADSWRFESLAYDQEKRHLEAPTWHEGEDKSIINHTIRATRGVEIRQEGTSNLRTFMVQIKLSRISQFEIAFCDNEFTKTSKLHHVGMHMNMTPTNWWLAKKLLSWKITTKTANFK